MAKKQQASKPTEKTEEQRKKEWEMHMQVLGADPCKCNRCGGIYFQQVYQIKKVNIAEGDKEDVRHVPLHGWKCVTCGNVIADQAGLK